MELCSSSLLPPQAVGAAGEAAAAKDGLHVAHPTHRVLGDVHREVEVGTVDVHTWRAGVGRRAQKSWDSALPEG